MSEAIIVAMIAGGLSLVGTIITVVVTNRQTIAAMDKKSELSDAELKAEIRVVKTEIDNLTAEVRRHNDFAQRVPILEEKAKAADRRLTDLEHKSA